MSVETWPARPTTYRGIAMRSRLEATVAGHLDRWAYEWRYEGRAFGGQGGQYLPDFELSVDGELRAVVEVKGEELPDDLFRDTLRRMRVVWDSEPEAFLCLVEAAVIRSGYYRTLGFPRASFIVQAPGMAEDQFVYGALGLCACGVVGLRFLWRDEGTLHVTGGCRGCSAMPASVLAYVDPTEYRA